VISGFSYASGGWQGRWWWDNESKNSMKIVILENKKCDDVRRIKGVVE